MTQEEWLKEIVGTSETSLISEFGDWEVRIRTTTPTTVYMEFAGPARLVLVCPKNATDEEIQALSFKLNAALVHKS